MPHTPHKQRLLRRVRRVVVKVGSSILAGPNGIEEGRLARLARELTGIAAQGRQVILVTSGAIAAGARRLGWRQRPRTVPERQAAAAVGQIGLMSLYDREFARHGLVVAQVLLTHDDLAHRRRYLNARHTFEELLRAGVVVIVNENDTVAVEEVLRNFGDNDNLSALVATLVEADLLVILSDAAGLYDSDPRRNPAAKLIPLVERITPAIRTGVGPAGGPLGTGGMATKLEAVHKATAAGIACVIADGLAEGVLPAVFDPDRSVGTLFLPHGDRLARRKHWIAYTLRPRGALVLDVGAAEAIRSRGRSLLASGVAGVRGRFDPGDCVSCLSPEGSEVARGLVNYGSEEIQRIRGHRSGEIEKILGYKIKDEVIHRDDLVVLDR